MTSQSVLKLLEEIEVVLRKVNDEELTARVREECCKNNFVNIIEKSFML